MPAHWIRAFGASEYSGWERRRLACIPEPAGRRRSQRKTRSGTYGAAYFAVLAGALLAGALLALMTVVPAARAEPPAPEAVASPQLREADREELRRVQLENRIETAQPRPGLSLYARDAAQTFGQWMAGWLEVLLPRFARMAGSWTEPLLLMLLALLALILFAYLARYAARRWLGPKPEPEPVRQLPELEDNPDPLDPRWEEELRHRLERGEIAAAVEALWWWLARRLVGTDAESSWTSRELIAKAGRRDLAPSVRRLDRMIYGSGRPSATEVTGLWNDLREAVG